MKKNLVIWIMAALCVLTAGFVYGGAGIGMRIDVPFDFYLEDQLLPAGEYSFEMDSGNFATAAHLRVWSATGPAGRMMFTSPGTDRTARLNQLTFNKYGDKYFLSDVLIAGHKATVKVFKLERELRSQIDSMPSNISIAQK